MPAVPISLSDPQFAPIDARHDAERIRWRVAPYLRKVCLLEVARCRDRVWSEMHESFDVCLVHRCEGAGRWWYRNKEQHPIGADSLQVMQPGEIHLSTPSNRHTDGDFVVFFIDPTIVAAQCNTAGISGCPNLVHCYLDHPEVVGLWKSLYMSFAGDEPGRCEELLIEALDALLLHSTRKNSFPENKFGPKLQAPRHLASPRVVQKAVEYIRDCLQADCSHRLRLDELVHKTGFSELDLFRTFKVCTGTTPVNFAIDCKIDFARHELAKIARFRNRVLDPIRFVAQKIGYSHEAFTRRFGRRYGVTPKNFLASHR